MAYKEKIDIPGAGDLAAADVADLKNKLLGSLSVMDVLVILTNGLHAKNDDFRQAPAADRKRWGELLDLMVHFENGVRQQYEEAPEHNPLTLINRLKKEGIIGREDAQALADTFNAKVRHAAGAALTEKQIQALFTLFREFDIGQALAARKPQEP